METTTKAGLIFNRFLSTIATFLCCFIFYLSYNQFDFSIVTTIGRIRTPEVARATTSEDNGNVNSTTSLSKGATPTPKEVASNHSIYNMRSNQTLPPEKTSKLSKLNQTEEELPKKQCDIFEGRWVYDEEVYSPVYEASQCPYLSNQVTCRKNGRPDFDYEKWRWEARDCKIPRFNGKEMLKRMKGKRVIIVGDSLNRNQWESLSCLLYSSISPKSAYVDVEKGDYKIFRAKEYGCTVEFYWSPFVVELDKTNLMKGKILKLDILPASAKDWRGADVMVFNTGHWWIHNGKAKAWDLMQYNGKVVKNTTVLEALEMALKTWGHWIDKNVDPAKTTVFFRSISPPHIGAHWCYNKTQPIKDYDSYLESFLKPIIKITERRISKMKTPVRYLNITKLSQYREDAHPQVYTTKQGKLLTEDERKQPKLYADCNHWCIPGVPDTWNQLLYTSIVLQNSSNVL